MSNKTRSVLRIIAVLLVLLAVLIELHVVSIPAINYMRFWMVVIGFGLMLISSK